MKALWSWFNNRTGLGDWCGWLADSPVSGPGLWVQGPAGRDPADDLRAGDHRVLSLGVLQPQRTDRLGKRLLLQYEVAGGWLLRAIHHYSAHVLLALLIIAVVRSILTGEYRAPRELVFGPPWGLDCCAGGRAHRRPARVGPERLRLDENADRLPHLLAAGGGSLLKIAIGGPGPALGHHTLTRFFALHAGIFGGRLHSIVHRPRRSRQACQCRGRGHGQCRALLARTGLGAVPAACLAVLILILLLACQHGILPPEAGVPLLSPADTDPANGYNAGAARMVSRGACTNSRTCSPANWPSSRSSSSPDCWFASSWPCRFWQSTLSGQVFNVLGHRGGARGAGCDELPLARQDRDNPEHQRAIALEEQQAQRVCELVRYEGIPPTGALTLLRNDPKTQAHGCLRSSVPAVMDTRPAAPPTAPKTSRRKNRRPRTSPGSPSRTWIAGLLNAKRVSGPDYFGNTKFRNGKMATFVKETLSELDDDQKKDLEKAIMALSAEARLPSQRDIDAKDAEAIQQGRKLLADDLGCTDCHKFHNKPGAGRGPEFDRLRLGGVGRGNHPQPGREAILRQSERPYAHLCRVFRSGPRHPEPEADRIGDPVAARGVV